jgi:ABC-type multidrug transport system fused ATPase/permease subunit
LAIARAILKNPKILLLGTFSHNKDEATSALDTQSEILVQQALDRLISGRTVITIAQADTICMIGNGKVIETGTYEELLRKQGPFSALVGEQLHNE